MIFMSFRHENDDHRKQVRELADRLVAAEIEVMLDELFLEAHPGGPDDGWPKWCADQVENAARVLIVASPGWFASYEKAPDNPGPGAACEAHVIRQLLYDAHYTNNKFRLVTFGEPDLSIVPTQLRGYHAYRADRAESLALMIRWLKGESSPGNEGHGWLESPPDLSWPFADNFPLHDAFATMITRESPHRVLLVQGESERGKTCATKQLITSAIGFEWLACGRLDFKGGTRFEDEISSFVVHLGVSEPLGTGDSLMQLKQIFNDLQKQARPTLLLFDTYEVVKGNPIGNWLENVVLLATPRADWLRVVIAGQEIPNRTSYQPWEAYSHSILLEKPTCADWIKFADSQRVAVPTSLVRGVFDATDGSAAVLSQLIGRAKNVG